MIELVDFNEIYNTEKITRKKLEDAQEPRTRQQKL